MGATTRAKVVIFLAASLAGWIAVSAWQWWQHRSDPFHACQTNLRVIYATLRTLAPDGNMRSVSVDHVAVALREGIRLSPGLDSYVIGVQNMPHEEASADRSARGVMMMGLQSALACPADPDYAVKVMMLGAPALGVESSYRFFPNMHTVASCPFHRIAVWNDGTIHRE
jgi:hypothetical protein